ncbi:CAP-Gly domain-containing linker protein 1-like isoform X3 [Daphnia carinata]|uniref:CAP-Gly domain-containing linker protein 1-like isoform X3 n=1 Tax=Daphnia carinata TaxID=120202 RepID=UPI0028686357|nr:CAP-Gly domain-containing linker protein 1-like isoform X3 [Daphnia carinata]
MSAPAPAKPSGIKPPTTRLARPSVTSKPASNGSSGENMSRLSSEDLPKKKTDRNEGLDDGDLDRVSDLPSLPGSRKTSKDMMRKLSDANLILTTDTDSFIIGQNVYVNGIKPGKIQFIGETKFAPGEWAGIVLDDLSGKNDGSVGGVRYFQCQPKKGVFSRLGRLTRQPLDAIQLAALQSQQSQPPAASENGDESVAGSASTNGTNGTSSASPAATPSTSVVSVQSIGDLRLGDRVIVTSSQGSKAGILRYLGTAEFAAGQWAGVELDDPLGKNDGAVAGTRYFDCQQHYGLFAPIHKVSRSPANHMRRTSGAMNTSMSSSLSQPRVGGASRTGTRRDSESASVTSVATSRASTAISRVRSTINNPRLGVNSLTNSPTHQSNRQKTSRPSVGGSAHTHQDLLRERDQHIEQLMKEREMERSEVTRAAAQADEAEHQLAVLQRRYNLEKEEFTAKIAEVERLLLAAESIRSSQGAQIDDLQFRLEEETILRGEIEAQQKGLDDKEKEWARQVEQLETEAQRCFEAEELAARYKDELDALLAKSQQQESSTSENDQSDGRIRQLEASVQVKENELTQLKNSMQELTKSLEAEQVKNNDTEKRFQALEGELQIARTLLNEAKNTVETEWKTKAEILELQNAENQEQLVKLNEEKMQFETRLNEAQALLSRSQDADISESHELKAKLEEMIRQYAASQEQVLKLNEEKSQLELQLTDSLATSNQTRHTVETEVNELKMKLDELERQAAKSEEQLFSLDEEKVQLELQLANAQAAIAESEEAKRAEVESNKQKLEEITKRTETLERLGAESSERLKQVEEEKIKLNTELEKALSLLEELKETSKTETDTSRFEFEELKAQYDALEVQRTEIQIQLANVEKEKIKSEDERVKLDAELQSVKVLLAESKGTATTEIEATKNEFAELKIKYGTLERQLEEVKTELENLQRKKIKSDEEKAKLEAELKTVQLSLSEYKEAMKVEAEKKQVEYEDLKGKCENLERQHAEVKVQLSNIQEEKIKIDEEKSRLDAELQMAQLSLSESIKATTTEAEKNKCAFEELKAQCEILKLKESEMEIQLANLIEEKRKSEMELQKKYEEEHEMWIKKFDDLERQKATNEQRLTQIDEEKSRLETELLRLSSKSSDTSQDLTRLHGELMVARQTSADWQSQASKLELEKTSLEQLNSAFSSDLQNSKKEITELISVKTEIELQLANLKEEKNKSEMALQKVCKEEVESWKQKVDDFEKQKTTNDQRLAQLDEEKSRLESELLQLSSVSSNTSQDLTRLRGELVSANETLVESQSQVSKLEQEKSSLEQINATLCSDLQNLEERISELSLAKIELERQIKEENQSLKDFQAQYEKDKSEWDRLSKELHENMQSKTKEITTLTAVLEQLKTQLQNANESLVEMEAQSLNEKSEWEKTNSALVSDLTSKEKHVTDLISVNEKYESELNIAKEECSRMKQLLQSLEAHQQESLGGMAELQKSIAVLEVEKSNWLAEKLRLEGSIAQFETRLSSLSNEKEKSDRTIQERDNRLAKLTEEVTLLQQKFTAHIAELEQKLKENRKTEETEQELQAALVEARARADEIQSALEESQKNEKELLKVREQLISANKLHEEFVEQNQKEKNELKQRMEELAAAKESMQLRELKLQEELTLLKRQVDEQTSRLKGQLDDTKKEAEITLQLFQDLEDANKRIKELQSNLEENDQKLIELQEVSLQVKSLEDTLALKTIELKEEMEDRDKAEDRVLRLTECLAVKEKELEALRLEAVSLKKSTTEVSHLLTAFSTVDREKKQLEAKVVELQVAAAAASRGAGADAADTDVRIKKLMEDYEYKEQEIKFLNSVIVDMQRKVEDLNVKLEISQATLLGQNVLTPENNRNGVKSEAKVPRLFCDICDLFDLHDTEDCPTQASEDFEISPPFLNQRPSATFNQNSPNHNQHSHHGGTRGATRPYCDNCEVFGHQTKDCIEEATF